MCSSDLILLVLEVLYYRDWAAARRLIIAGAAAGVAALPLHWESIRYSSFVRVNNELFDPTTAIDWHAVARNIYYNIEILAFPQRWFNDYRSLVNVWWPAVLIVALDPRRSRAGFYACATLLAQALLRLNTAGFGVAFDRVQHLFPLLAAPALAGFVVMHAGTRRLALAMLVVLGLYVQLDFRPVPHVATVRDFDATLVERVAAADGALVLVENSPHHILEQTADWRSPKTPFNVHFEGLLPGATGRRIYGQMWDGWAWNIFRGQVVAAGTFAGHRIDRTSPDRFEGEMRRWGVTRLFVWSDATRDYLARAQAFVERSRHDRWSEFELIGGDSRSVVVTSGSGRLARLSPLGADVELDNVSASAIVVVRTNFYPAWRATMGGQAIPLFSRAGQLAFTAPSAGSYVVRLEYPKRRGLMLGSLLAFIAGMFVLMSYPKGRRNSEF